MSQRSSAFSKIQCENEFCHLRSVIASAGFGISPKSMIRKSFLEHASMRV
jgi:hypothetical protein